MTVPDPNEKITYRSLNIYGEACIMGRRTAAHLDSTRAKLAASHPGDDIKIIQSCWHTGVKASAGTHDKDACLDVYIPGWGWLDSQWFLREDGWAAFFRYPPLFSYHIHMISLGFDAADPVGIYVPGQVTDYYNHRTGLVGHYADDSQHPDDIKATIFDFPAYLKEDDMPTVDDILNANVSPDMTVKQALRQAAHADDVQHQLTVFRSHVAERDQGLSDDLGKLIDSTADDATKKQLNRLRAKLVETIGAKDTTKP